MKKKKIYFEGKRRKAFNRWHVWPLKDFFYVFIIFSPEILFYKIVLVLFLYVGYFEQGFSTFYSVKNIVIFL